MKKRILQNVVSIRGKLDELSMVVNNGSPGFLSLFISGDYMRHKSMMKTINQITDPKKLQQLQQHAINNLTRWQNESEESPLQVDVEPLDWGVAALHATKTYGEPYALLNMANSEFPGGLVLEGGSAQEENIWHRTTCALTLIEEGVYLDREKIVYRYDDKTSRLVSGQEKLSPQELQLLNELRNEQLTEANKVYFNPCPQICFRGPEIRMHHELEYGKNNFFADHSLSFDHLSESKIFPFYELRSAAPDLSGTKVDWQDPNFLESYIKTTRREIAAQLDTLILAGIPNVILGAWGCGSFKNNPEIISKIYREEIEKRGECFQHIIFSILNTRGYSESFSFFQKELGGLKLDYSPNQSSSLTSVESVRENFSLSPMSVFEDALANESESIIKRRD